ncbi:MAG TPA: hypothetical protein VF586_14615 [Pyrinomonadaceae bacterium]|jgi:AraC-like DNA-binding protein
MKKEEANSSPWDGSVFFLGRERVVFIGKAGTSVDQAVHAVKVCVALDGEFELAIGSGAVGRRHSAAIINAGLTHTVRCRGTRIFLLYLLPETRAARQLRWEYLNNDRDNTAGGVYDIPKKLLAESLPFLQQMLRTYRAWECPDASRYAAKVIGGLGRLRHRQFTTSYGLGEQINDKVKQAIDYIHAEIEGQVKNQRLDLSRFETPAVCAGIDLSPDKAGWLEKVFRSETGTTIGHYFHDIQLLAALKLYATEKKLHDLDEEMRNAAERKLLQELKNSTISRRDAAELLERPDEVPKGVFLMQIAKSLGFGAPARADGRVKGGPDAGEDSKALRRALTNFDHRVKSRLGINMADLRGRSTFFSCEEPPG